MSNARWAPRWARGLGGLLSLAALLLGLARVAPAQPSFRDALLNGSSKSEAKAEAAPEAEARAEAEAPPNDAAAPSDAPETRADSPRAAVERFLDDSRAEEFEAAASFLDLGTLPPRQRAARGAELARQLDFVLDRKAWIDPEQLSSRPSGEDDDNLAKGVDRLATIDTGAQSVELFVERVTTPSGEQVWKLSRSSVRKVPALHAQVSRGPLGELLPAMMFDVQFLELQLWQWIGLLALVVVATLASLVAVAVAQRLLRPILRRTSAATDEGMLRVSRGPARLVIAVLVFSGGKMLLGLPLVGYAFLDGIETVLLLIAFTWLMIRLLDVFTEGLRRRMLQRGHSNAVFLVPPARRAGKVALVAIATIALLDNLGFNVTAIVAGLGIGGIAVALAAQKSVENLFGGITLYVDQPVRIGDFCKFGDRLGHVEDIGLRSTRVRTLDRTVVSVPNAEFANLQLENYSQRDRIWYHPTLGLRYETTPDQVRYLLVEIRKMLYAHPKVDPEPARIRFVGFGAYSLDFEVFAYVKTRDYGEYLEIAEDLNLRIMDLVAQAGASFAFPSQTTYLEEGERLDSERIERAEQRVREWRERNALYLPRFPAEKIRELDDTLDYPPAGSPDGGRPRS